MRRSVLVIWVAMMLSMPEASADPVQFGLGTDFQTDERCRSTHYEALWESLMVTYKDKCGHASSVHTYVRMPIPLIGKPRKVSAFRVGAYTITGMGLQDIASQLRPVGNLRMEVEIKLGFILFVAGSEFQVELDDEQSLDATQTGRVKGSVRMDVDNAARWLWKSGKRLVRNGRRGF